MLGSLNGQLEAATQQLAQMEQAKSYAESQLAQMLQLQQQAREAQKLANPGIAIGSQDPLYQQQQRDLQSLQTRESELMTQYTRGPSRRDRGAPPESPSSRSRWSPPLQTPRPASPLRCPTLPP